MVFGPNNRRRSDRDEIRRLESEIQRLRELLEALYHQIYDPAYVFSPTRLQLPDAPSPDALPGEVYYDFEDKEIRVYEP